MDINKTLFSILIMFISLNSFTQEGTLVLVQDQKLTKLMELKKEVNSVDFTSGQYTVQVFNGQYEKGIELIEELMSDEKFKDVYFSFETPYYKIRIGKFVSKIEAIKELQKIKKTFPSAFILKPN
ncbi:MAG: sporulation protein [Flavobacteriaceae bacterium]|nr:sporulation protein [Flavobacteriaceae bacterium]RCL67475.1 MAG: SPOR domain-containing protein [Cryomorphaceae bacterium]|tara:strand:- start:1843 stop:2217 length:375 start_codon:yes stop_codon:yes gene_type:complete